MVTSTPIRLSNSKVKTWRRCPRRYQFKYIEKLRPKSTGLPLKRGDWLHQLLMTHYDGESWKDRQAELTKEFMKLFEEEREEYGDLPGECARIMKSYLQTYRKEDKHYTVIDSELDELIELPNGDQFNFIIDLIVEDEEGGLWLWDHKTVKSFMPPDFMLLDAQLARYFWCAELMGYKPLRGVMFNEIITKPPTVPALLQSGKLTERKNLMCDVHTYMAEIKKHDLDPKDYGETLARLRLQDDRWFRRTKMPRDRQLTIRLMRELLMSSNEIKLATKRNHFPRSVSKDCAWDCEFLEPCMIELQGGDTDDVIKLKYDRRETDIAKEEKKN